VSVYSLRAREHPTVSTPVTWEEVERALKKKDASLLVFEAPQVIERFEKMGDLHAPVLELKQKLPDLRGVAAAAATPATVDLAAQAEDSREEPAPKRTAAKSERGHSRKASSSARKTRPKKAAKPAVKKRRAV
jgi:bifunctional non-homologous end joining protein LigD